MKQFTLVLLLSVLLFSCRKNNSSSTEENQHQSQRECATNEAVQSIISADPSVKQRMDEVESFTNRMIASGQVQKNAAGTITIPVIVHVLYNKAEENISAAQIQSQIDVLNEDFNLRNTDRNQVPGIFSGAVADVGVKFELAQVVRKATNKKTWPANDGMKFSQQGGSDAIDPQNNLNIWVCNLAKYLGYAYYPGITPERDGVVCLYSAFGRTGTLLSPYDKGRTATHEVGHYLNLRHIWGDATCGTDLVDDTPQHNTYNFGCPTYPHLSTCAGTPVEMTMNYMDYTDDACMFMFSNGQKSRMLSLFVPGGPRAAFAN